MTQVLGVKPVVWVHGNTHHEFSTPTARGNKKHSHSYVISGEEQYTYWSWASLGNATPYLYCHGTGPEGLLEGSEPAQALTMKQVTLGTSGHDFFITCYSIIWMNGKHYTVSGRHMFCATSSEINLSSASESLHSACDQRRKWVTPYRPS